mgnify:FL=1
MNTCKMPKKLVTANYKQKEELYFFVKLKAFNYKNERGFVTHAFMKRDKISLST